VRLAKSKPAFESLRFVHQYCWGVIAVQVMNVLCCFFVLFCYGDADQAQAILITQLAAAFFSSVLLVLSFRLRSSFLDVKNFMLHNIRLDSDIVDNIAKEKRLGKVLQEIVTYKHDTEASELMGNYLKQQAELAALYQQINPHFLYNTLESIRGLALMNDAPDVANMTGALSSLFRKTLKNSGKLVTLEEEIESVENYLLIQQFRFLDRFAFHKHFNHEDPFILNCPIPHLTLQPIVENAIYHGLEHCTAGGEIHFFIRSTDQRVIMKITDNGKGIKLAVLDAINDMLHKGEMPSHLDGADSWHMGVGLMNINLRIRHQFGHQYGILLRSVEGMGTEAEITLPALGVN